MFTDPATVLLNGIVYLVKIGLPDPLTLYYRSEISLRQYRSKHTSQ